MLANLICCNLCGVPPPFHTPKTSLSAPRNTTPSFRLFLEPLILRPLVSPFRKRALLHLRPSTLKDDSASDEASSALDSELTGNPERDWTTSFLLFLFWGALLYYVFNLTPNQTPAQDMYLLKKLLNLKGDDGFMMNSVLVSLWYIMGLWPLVYSMLLLPTGRSTKSSVPVWPFLLLSFFGGAYALLPYFVLWKPPPSSIDESELKSWPLNFLDSKYAAVASLVAGLGLILYAGLQSADVWKEFYQYFRESKFIHVTCIDFTLLSAFAPFWVYNDMTVRKWYDKGSWLVPLSVVPFLGPSLYIVLRPSLSELPVSVSSPASGED